MAFPETALDVQVRIALGADLTVWSLLWTWTDVTSYVLVDDLIVITRGRGDEHSTAPPATCRLTVRNTDGRWCRTNPVGTWYGQLTKNTPLQVRVNNGAGYDTRFTGLIDELPPRWDVSGRWAYAPVTASGVLRRVKQGGALRSMLYRVHTIGLYSSGAPVAYWPMEDASGSTSFASGLGGPAATFTDMSPGSGSGIAGSASLATGGANATLNGRVPAYTSTGEWAVRWVMKLPTAVTTTTGIMSWSSTGSVTYWTLFLVPGSPDTLFLRGFNSSGVDQLGDTGLVFTNGADAELYDQQLYVEVDATQNGANIDWEYRVWHVHDGTQAGGDGGSFAGTLGTVVGVYHSAAPGLPSGYTLGHIAVGNDTGYGAGGSGVTGSAGETTWFRLQRLLDEENLIWHTVDPSRLPSTPMGAQPIASLQQQIDEVASTEAMPVCDSFDATVQLDSRATRYNAAAALTLDRTAAQWADTPEPADDDRQLRNDVTVTSTSGSSARATQLTGPCSVAVGVYTQSVAVNTQHDDVLPHHAQWYRHLGTVDDLRWPQMTLNLARATSKINDWLACDIGSRVRLTNPPSQLPPDAVDLILEGYTETLGPRLWTVRMNCSPATPWDVFKLEDNDLGRLDTAGSYLLTSATSAGTSLLVATSDGPQWSTTAEPYDWWIAGEKVTCTAASANAAAFVNAGTAAHADNASVTPGMPAGVQQGDLLLVFAAVRSTSAAVSTPSGYTALVTTDANVRLFGKVHTGTESAPAVSFTGGSAGDTTSAQMAAFRYAQLVRHGLASQSNSSAQDIATPALDMGRDRCVVLALAWKQDDWTSVTPPGGFTEIGEPSSATGDDQGITWAYVIQATSTSLGASSFVVTGGASAVSKAYIVAIHGDVQPCTVTRAVNGVSKAQSAGAAVSLWRPGAGGLAL